MPPRPIPSLRALCALLLAAGGALAAPSALHPAVACHDSATGWDMACVRAAYAGEPASWPQPQGVDDGNWAEMAPIDSLPPSAVDPAQAALGERLFFDPRLSRSDLIACASCHRPTHGFADTQALSAGHEGRLGSRNTPTVLGAGHASSLFWDGRAASLEEQAAGPIAHPDEMAMALDELPAKLAAIDGYPGAFTQAFGAAGKDGAAITLERITAALAAYQRTLLPPQTRFDRFLAGERAALDERELLGLHLFRTKGRCMSCHHGALLTDHDFHNLGLTWYGRQYEDLGRYMVSGDPADVGRFRTPTLRQVGNTGPWMHNGRFASLRGVLNMYNAGMPRPQPGNAGQAADPLFPQTSTRLQRLELDADELDAVHAFLLAL